VNLPLAVAGSAVESGGAERSGSPEPLTIAVAELRK
jgi:hypothetical protein